MLANRTTTGLALAAMLAAVATFLPGAGPPAPAESSPPRFRQPVAMALARDGAWLFAANRRSGTLSIIETGGNRVSGEAEVGRGLADVAVLPDGRHLVAVDRAGDSLIVLDALEGSVTVEGRLAVAPDPVKVLIAPDGSACVVASTGSRRLSVVELGAVEGGKLAPRLARSIALPFGPGALAWAVPGSRLVAADAFGGRIAVIDPGRDALESIRSLPGHNIGGLAVSPDGRSMVVAHQSLSRLARSSFEDIHWGSLVNNHLRVLRLDALLAPGSDSDLIRGGRRFDLGEVGRAAADPGAIDFAGRGNLAVVLAGVDEVALGPDASAPLARVGVGRAPSALVTGLEGKVVYVADSLDDAISVVDVATARRIATIPLGARPDLDPAGRGERLFSDARLSHDAWMSCRSCHPDGQTIGRLADTLGDGSYGAAKRITTLRGVGATGPWTWLGSVGRLEDQVRKSIETTMRGKVPTDGQIADLTAYLRSIPPPRPNPTAGREEAESRGREVFRTRKCAECHAPPEFTSSGRYDVGLVDEVGNRLFNPPSLRGITAREPLLHDGRAATLPDVFLRHRHPLDAQWTIGEVDDLVAFLGTL